MGKSLNISLVATLTPLQKSLELVGKMMSDFAKSIETTDKKLSDSIKASVSQMNTELAKVQSSFDGVGKAGDAAGAKGSKGFKGMRAQMMEANNAALKALQTFGEFSPEFIAAAKNAARVRDEMGDLDSQIKALNPDAPFKAAVGVMQGLIGGVEVAKGAMVAFGLDSEGAEKSIAKLQGLMAMGQGLNELAEMRDKMKDFKLATLNSLPALNSMKGAIMATGIGLVIVAVGLLAANWDKVTEAVGGVSAEQKTQLEKGKESVKQQQDKLKLIESQDNVYKLQGKSEREILNIKIAQTKEVINAVAADIEHQKGILKSQIAAAERNKNILAGILRGIADPIMILLRSIDGIGKALGKNFELAKGLSDGIKSISEGVFDPEETRKKGAADIKEMEVTLAEMKNKQAGYQISVQEIYKKTAAEKKKLGEDAVKDEAERLMKIAEAELQAGKSRFDQEANQAKQAKDEQIKIQEDSAKIQKEIWQQYAEEKSKLEDKEAAEWLAKNELTFKKNYDLIKALNQSISTLFADTATLVGESLGKMFSGGFSGAEALQSILGMVANFAKQLGQAIITIGTTVAIFQSQILINPLAAVGIGVALVAGAALMNAKLQSMKESKPGFAIGSRYIPYDMTAQIHKGEMIIPASENPYANSGGRVMPGGGGGGVMALSTTLRGNDIRISAKKTNRTYNRITGRG